MESTFSRLLRMCAWRRAGFGSACAPTSGRFCAGRGRRGLHLSHLCVHLVQVAQLLSSVVVCVCVCVACVCCVCVCVCVCVVCVSMCVCIHVCVWCKTEERGERLNAAGIDDDMCAHG